MSNAFYKSVRFYMNQEETRAALNLCRVLGIEDIPQLAHTALTTFIIQTYKTMQEQAQQQQTEGEENRDDGSADTSTPTEG